MKRFKKKDFIGAYWFLYQHPYYAIPYLDRDGCSFSAGFDKSLDIEPRKINPITNSVDDREELNTKNIVWLESGCYCLAEEDDLVASSYLIDYSLNVQGNTFEKAIIKLANKILKRYGDESIHKYFNDEVTDFKKWENLINK